jgi:hypothetical protein
MKWLTCGRGHEFYEWMWVEYWIGGDQPKDITRMVASCGLEMILAIISAVLCLCGKEVLEKFFCYFNLDLSPPLSSHAA